MLLLDIVGPGRGRNLKSFRRYDKQLAAITPELID